jgi:hypothetical protein
MVTHWIQAYIFPFPGLAFRGAEFVIVDAVLPTPGAWDASPFVFGTGAARWGHRAYIHAVRRYTAYGGDAA